MNTYNSKFVGKDNPRANKAGYVHNHIYIAEKALGHYLEPQNEIHHINEIKSDDSNSNLVICEDAKYHKLLHFRQRILNAGGNPDKDKICGKCKLVKPKRNFSQNLKAPDGKFGYCKPCAVLVTNEYNCNREYMHGGKKF